MRSTGSIAPGALWRVSIPIFRCTMGAALFACLLGGCAKQADTAAPETPRERQLIPAPPTDPETLALMKSAVVTCESTSSLACPSSVALLVSKRIIGGKKFVEQCTSFLVGERTLITNSHCLSEDLRAPGRSCAGRISAIFPATASLPTERADCESILMASPVSDDPGAANYGHSPDYAILKLNRPVKRQALALSREGLPDLKSFIAYAIDPVSDSKPEGILRVKKCYAVQTTTLFPAFNHAFHPVASMSDCKIVEGNSGAPLVDTEGRARAIAQAYLRPDPKDAISIESIRFPLSLATNAACITLPEDLKQGPINPDCSRPSVDKNGALKKKYAEADLGPITDLFEKWRSETISPLRFTLRKIVLPKSEFGEFVVTTEISCVNRPTRTDGQGDWREYVKIIDGRHVRIDLRAPVWAYGLSVDSRLRYVMKPFLFTHLSGQIIFDIKDLLANGKTVGTADFVREGSAAAELPFRTPDPKPIAIKLCDEAPSAVIY